MRRIGFLVSVLLLGGAGAAWPQQEATSVERDYLYLWTASADSTEPDFLAVLDVTEGEGDYGRLLTTRPVPGLRHVPHHTEHELPADRQLFANGFASGTTFVFDLSDPAHPRLARRFQDVEGYTHPHSYIRLSGGNVL